MEPIDVEMTGATQHLAADPLPFSRNNQLEALEKAIKQNTVVFLETGSGKTLIAIKLLRSYAYLLRKPSPFFAVLLVPKVVLVQQQSEALMMHTGLKVGKYCGELGVDYWDAATWRKQVDDFEVLVMTPAILLAALRHSFLKIDMIKVLIFDECHNARGKDDYACIMKEFYHQELKSNPSILPRIFVMAASPVIKAIGRSSESAYWQQIQELENLMHSKGLIQSVKSYIQSIQYLQRTLEIGELKPTTISLQLADRSIRYPVGLVENLLVKVGKLIFSADFFVMDMYYDAKVPIILGRPFMATGGVVIDVQQGILKFRIGNEEEVFSNFKLDKVTNSETNCQSTYKIDKTLILEHPIDSHITPYLKSIKYNCGISNDSAELVHRLEGKQSFNSEKLQLSSMAYLKTKNSFTHLFHPIIENTNESSSINACSQLTFQEYKVIVQRLKFTYSSKYFHQTLQWKKK